MFTNDQYVIEKLKGYIPKKNEDKDERKFQICPT